MNMKYYNASNNFSAPIKREPKPYSPYERRPAEVIVPKRPPSMPVVHKEELPKHNTAQQNQSPLKTLNLNNLKSDDILLLGIIALLIWNSCDDTLLLLALGYLFLVGL